MKKSHDKCTRVSILCEINDGIIMDACTEPLAVGERELALKHIEYFETIREKKDLMIFNRGYASKEMISVLAKEISST